MIMSEFIPTCTLFPYFFSIELEVIPTSNQFFIEKHLTLVFFIH